jgi:hypothetical protein
MEAPAEVSPRLVEGEVDAVDEAEDDELQAGPMP